MSEKYEEHWGIYCGRFNPVHKGHEAVIEEMINIFGHERSRVIIGSANTPQSLRHFFSYEERRDFLKTIFPEIKIVPLPDFHTSDKEWLTALDDLLISSGMDPEKTIFFGGCEEDISFFINNNRKYHILNRFDGTTPKISATEIRDSLIHERDTENFLNPLIEKKMKDIFKTKWLDFKNK